MNPFAAAYNFWMGIPPPLREPVRSAVVSYGLALGPAFGALLTAGFAQGQLATPQFTAHYIAANWWITFLGAFFNPASALRASQAKTRVANTVTLPSGAEAVVTKPATG